jgi:hypothetical protein
MEGHTEIGHVMRPVVFWDFTQYKVVIPIQSFGINDWVYFQGSTYPRRNVLKADSLHMLDVLEELFVIELTKR